MNQITTRAQLSRDIGISKAAITKAAERGDIILTKQGKVDLEHRITLEYIRRHKDDYQPPAEEKKPPKKKPAKKPAKKTEKKPEKKKEKKPEPPGTGEQLCLPINDIASIDRSNIHLYEKKDLEKLKIFEQAILENLKVKEKEGKLIDRALVAQVFSKIYTIDTEQLRSLEDNLTPKICGIFNVSDDTTESIAVKKEINIAVTKALDHIKRLIDEFLIGVGEGKVK